jgi:hypothetical protein
LERKAFINLRVASPQRTGNRKEQIVKAKIVKKLRVRINKTTGRNKFGAFQKYRK